MHGEAIYEAEGGDVCEMITRWYQTVRGNALYLVLRFWARKTSVWADGRERG